MTQHSSGSNKTSESESRGLGASSPTSEPTVAEMEASIPPLDIYVKYLKGVYLVTWSGRIRGKRLETCAHQFGHYPTHSEITKTKDIAVRAFWRAGQQLGEPTLKHNKPRLFERTGPM